MHRPIALAWVTGCFAFGVRAVVANASNEVLELGDPA
jgi:hypothetical protein